MPTEHTKELLVDQALAGKRLDHALDSLVPAFGLRGRRRLIAQGAVLLNGRLASSATKLRPGDRLEIMPEDADLAESQSFALQGPRLLAQAHGLAFLSKPRGLHSVSLAGGRKPSLEALLPRLCSKLALQMPEEKPRLLQRLDFGTSGLLCAALNPEAEQVFRRSESLGQVEKCYLALLCGAMAQECSASQALGGGRKVQLLKKEAPPLRWSHFQPLKIWHQGDIQEILHSLGREAAIKPKDASLPDPSRDKPPLPKALTLALVCIKRGARHQIRAHAMALGYPLFGDVLYGAMDNGMGFFLHATALRMQLAKGVDYAIVYRPSWLLNSFLSEEQLAYLGLAQS